MNYWIMQGSPTKVLFDWQMEVYFKNHPTEHDWWLIEKQYRRDIAPEDRIIFWKAKNEPAKKLKPDYFKWKQIVGVTKPVAGIVAIGVVKTLPEHLSVDVLNNPRDEKYHVDKTYKYFRTKSDPRKSCLERIR